MTVWGAISHLLASVAQLEQRVDRLEAAHNAKEKPPAVKQRAYESDEYYSIWQSDNP